MQHSTLTLAQELQNSMEFENSANIQIPETNEILKKKLEIKLHSDEIYEDTLDDNVEAKYPYYDENGEIKFTIVRFKKPNADGNLFAVESRGPDGQTSSGMNGNTKLPYNIPNLIKANGKVVYIVNGEDKVEALRKLGITATTGPFSSAKKWEKTFNKYLENAGYIVILQDNKDTPQYNKFIGNTFKIIKSDYHNITRIKISEYFDYFGVEPEMARTIIDLINLVPNEQIMDFFTSIQNKVLNTREVQGYGN